MPAEAFKNILYRENYKSISLAEDTRKLQLGIDDTITNFTLIRIYYMLNYCPVRKADVGIQTTQHKT